MSIVNMKRIIAAREKSLGKVYNQPEVNNESELVKLIESLFNYMEMSNDKIIKNLEELTEKIDNLGERIK